MVCTFFGHSECYGLDKAALRDAIEDLINQGITEFLVGNHGQFDGMVFSCLQDLGKEYPEISYSVALAYLPMHRQEYDIYHGHSFYPEGQEIGPAKFAIERRNHHGTNGGSKPLPYDVNEGKYWKAIGIVRRVDDLGRIVIPKKIRRTLKIEVERITG